MEKKFDYNEWMQETLKMQIKFREHLQVLVKEAETDKEIDELYNDTAIISVSVGVGENNGGITQFFGKGKGVLRALYCLLNGIMQEENIDLKGFLMFYLEEKFKANPMEALFSILKQSLSNKEDDQ